MVLAAFLLLGISWLWIGTELAVGAAARIAQRFHISQAVIGLTILAIGTDLPELIVAIAAGADKLDGAETSGIAVGNAVGSAITQITFVLGIAGLTGLLTMGRRDLVHGAVATILAVVAVLAVVIDGSVTRVEGALLIVAYGAYLIFLLAVLRSDPDATGEAPTRRAWLDITRLLVGIAVVVAGAELVVENGVGLAEAWDVDESLVAVLVIALGTSLPELAVSLRAAAEGKPGLSVGNIIGSNIFDLLVPIGVAAMIAGLEVERITALFDLPFLLVISLIALALLTAGSRLRRREATLLIGAYVVYAAIRAAAEAL